MFELHFSRFLELLPRSQETVNLAPMFKRLILDAGSDFIFGACFDSLLPDGSADGNEFMAAFEYAQGGLSRRRGRGWLDMLVPRDTMVEESCKVVRNHVYSYIDRAIEQQQKRHDEGEENIEQTDDLGLKPRQHYQLVKELSNQGHNRERLIGQLIQVFFGAHDTAAIVLMNAVFLLARNPHAWAQLRMELQDQAHEDLTFESLKGFKYLQWIVKEALRLYPSVPTTTRVCLRDTALPSDGGLKGTLAIAVSAGTLATLILSGMQRQPDHYGTDADKFRPERWEKLRAITWEYIPFLGDPRVCPAQILGLFWVTYGLARMVQTFERIENRYEMLEFV